jgi:uncharacterized membrane protein
MAFLHSLLFIAHIVLGSMALILFWIPMTTKKGGLDHKKFGRYYGYVMYAVALSGALMALMVIYDPIAIKGQMMSAQTDPAQFQYGIRIFWGFLLYLSLLTYVSVRQGFAVLEARNQIQALRKVTHTLPTILLAIGGVGIFSLGVLHDRILHMVFGILGVVIGISMLRYCLKREVAANEWVMEHLGAMIGSAIGAYTAFIAFGGRQIFENLGQYQLIFWVAPGIIGSIAIRQMSRKYQTKKPAKQ